MAFRSGLKEWITGVSVGVAYFFAALAGISLSFQQTNISPVWPPAGIALASLLLLGIRFWPFVTAGAFLANYLTGLPLPIAAGISVGNTLEAVCGAWIIRKFAQSRNPLSNIPELSVFFAVALTCTVLSATIGTGCIFLGGLSHGVAPGYLWWTWWLGDSVGIIAFAPLFISWSEGYSRWALPAWAEFIGALLAIAVVGILPFSGFLQAGSVLYASVPLIVLAAYRFTQKGASAAIGLLSLIAIIGTIHGNGPFLAESLNESLLMLQTFIGVIAITALVVAAVTRENRALLLTTQSQLQEKEVLVGEIHHRVKNNLQVMSSLLALQMKSVDESSREILRQNQNRVHTMALLHEKLYESPNFAKVDFAKYIMELSRMIFDCYPSEHITLKVNCEPMYIGVEKAIPCGLILNEIITNSLKHGFPESRIGEISISLRQEGDMVRLEVSDNGIGFPENFDAEASTQLGLRLVNILIGQLRGTESRMNVAGSHYIFHFPMPAKS